MITLTNVCHHNTNQYKTPEQPNEIILIIYFNFRRSLINHSSVDKGRTNNINARRPFPVKERNEEKVCINGDGQQISNVLVMEICWTDVGSGGIS
jgi:hypothetical protein